MLKKFNCIIDFNNDDPLGLQDFETNEVYLNTDNIESIKEFCMSWRSGRKKVTRIKMVSGEDFLVPDRIDQILSMHN